ncbi:sporulation lipoprotein, YhcN/YlaJ family [Thalassobacillus cyri]|uniref:Sporulation lipoprotein, YhcN/YlaJ family n=1 Tax=Thalassobacillus cyri TaxID=571932 RepID=A0A1H4HFB7_9BACI|nr:YhcN/YlaJ family sporulation lipoprotein [Thalassobacillus cyri]SEB20533.1 sporulation lipoprotein, YhcN/YlaJ family [Thalassobacillus cyri]
MKIKTIALSFLATTALVACQADPEEGAQNNDNINGPENVGFERDAEEMADGDDRGKGDMRSTNYEVADQAAKTITDQVEGVDRANVLTTRNNAYVAVVIDGKDKGDKNGNNNDTNGTNNDLGNQMNNANGVRDNGNNDNGMDVGRNEDGDVSDEMKKKIADIVKNQNEDIDNVYVSTNPDFVDLTTNYANNVDGGEPVEGFFRQFGEMVDRIFPDAE